MANEVKINLEATLIKVAFFLTLACLPLRLAPLMAQQPPAQELSREEFLRKFAKDPSVVQETPAIPSPTPEANQNGDELAQIEADQKKLNDVIQKHQNQAGMGNQEIPGEDGEKVKGSIDLEKLKNLQNMLGQKNGEGVDFKKLMESMGGKGGSNNGQGGLEAMVRQVTQIYRMQSETNVFKMFQDKLHQSFLGPLFKNTPLGEKFARVLTRIFRHESALPYVAKIPNERRKLLIYAGFVLATFIIGFGLKKLQQGGNDSILTTFRRNMTRLVIINGSRFVVFYFFFKAELSPLVETIKSAW